jgi:hypothetical protein
VCVIAERANIPLTALTILKCELKLFAGVGHQGVSSEQDAMAWPRSAGSFRQHANRSEAPAACKLQALTNARNNTQ